MLPNTLVGLLNGNEAQKRKLSVALRCMHIHLMLYFRWDRQFQKKLYGCFCYFGNCVKVTL